MKSVFRIPFKISFSDVKAGNMASVGTKSMVGSMEPSLKE